MCDGLSEFSSEDGKVTAVSITNLDQGIELLSQVSSDFRISSVPVKHKGKKFYRFLKLTTK